MLSETPTSAASAGMVAAATAAAKRRRFMMKLLWLGCVNTPWLFLTEDLIERAATESCISGQPYEVGRDDGTTAVSRRWLRRLAWFRLFNKEAGLDSLCAQACPRCQELRVGHIWTSRASAWEQDLNRPA